MSERLPVEARRLALAPWTLGMPDQADRDRGRCATRYPLPAHPGAPGHPRRQWRPRRSTDLDPPTLAAGLRVL